MKWNPYARHSILGEKNKIERCLACGPNYTYASRHGIEVLSVGIIYGNLWTRGGLGSEKLRRWHSHYGMWRGTNWIPEIMEQKLAFDVFLVWIGRWDYHTSILHLFIQQVSMGHSNWIHRSNSMVIDMEKQYGQCWYGDWKLNRSYIKIYKSNTMSGNILDIVWHHLFGIYGMKEIWDTMKENEDQRKL